MSDATESLADLPDLCGAESEIEAALRQRPATVFLDDSRVGFEAVRSACAIALHMHQPLIPAGGGDLRTARMVSNLADMLAHPEVADNHNAHVFRWCYKRMGEFIPRLLEEGREPRVMLEYSGTLLHGLQAMGWEDVVDSLRPLAQRREYRRCV